MRTPLALLALAALACATLLAPPPVRAAGGTNVKAAAPLVRAGGAVATGQGLVSVAAKGTKVNVAFSVAKLPADVAAPLGVFVEDGAGAGTFTQAASIATLKHGAGKVALASASGPPAGLGVAALADLVGRAVQVRRGDGTALLAAKFPALEKFVGTKVSAAFGPSEDSALAKFSAKVTGTPSPKTGSEKFLVKAKGLLPGVVYTLFMEDAPDSGVFVAVGDLHGGQFLRDQAKGDSLPFAAAALVDLGGRAVEVRDPSGPVGRGYVPMVFFSMQWPQDNVLILDEADTDDDRYLRFIGGVVVYRSVVDLTTTSIATLVAEGESNWLIRPVGSVTDGLVCTFRLVDDDRKWWQVGLTGGVHFLGIRDGVSPPANDDGKFILRFGDKVGGHRTARIESFRFPGEFLVDQGHDLTANGIRFSSVGDPATFVLR